MANALGQLFVDIANAIRSKTGEEGTMKPAEFPAKIAGIEVGGGSSDDVRYVTFMNSSEFLYKKPVATGDDCVNVVSKGLISKPTKESTISTVYTYSGWALTDGGNANSSALKAVEEDRTVYAAYTESVRTYTITYYDDDGTTVLYSETLEYGAMPSYTPVKAGFTFGGWEPKLQIVEGDASYKVSIWRPEVKFASSDWSAISAVCEAGMASEYFSVGESRTEVVTYESKKYAITFKIAGIEHDDLADGTGKAGISVVTHSCLPVKVTPNASTNSQCNSILQSVLPNIWDYVKSVRKQYNVMYLGNPTNTKNTVTTGTMKGFLLSCKEAGWDRVDGAKSSVPNVGTTYALYATNELGKKGNADVQMVGNQTSTSTEGSTSGSLLSRDAWTQNGDSTNHSVIYYYISDGKTYRTFSANSAPIGFCI